MSLIKREPFDEFDRFFRDTNLFPTMRNGGMGFDMAVDVYEDNDNLVAEMNLPGLSANEIDVEVEEKKQKSHYAKEIKRGSFERVVTLPSQIDQAKVEADYHDGVLKVKMPKLTKTRENKVKVNVK